MGGAKGNDEAVFKRQRHVESDKGTGALAQVANVILTVGHVVLDNHVSVTDTVVFVLLDYEIVVDIPFCTVLERAQNSATVVFASLRTDKTLRIDIHAGSSVGLRAFNDLDAKAFSLGDLVKWDDNSTQR